jgi:peptidoglycan/LPS O-acetylase OafA/YrhL
VAVETIEPTVVPGDSHRYEVLDSLRGIAACWVILFHLPSTGHLWPIAFFQHGFLAVTFFFVLSGFVISVSYGDKLARRGSSVTAFMLKRLGRIYPLHLLALAVPLAYEILRLVANIPTVRNGAPFTGFTAPEGLFWNIVLLQDVQPERTWNAPSWSIGVEFWTYLLFALILVVLRVRSLTLAAILLILPFVALSAMVKVHPFAIPLEINNLLGCACPFGVGVLVYQLRRSRIWQPVKRLSSPTMTVIELVTVLLVITLGQVFGGKFSHLVYPIFGLVVAVFAQQAGLLSRLLRTKPMLVLGALSYSIYMMHHFIQDRLMDLLWFIGGPLVPQPTGRIVLSGPAWACDALVVVELAIVIAVASITYRYVEVPARLWSRKFVDRHVKR